MDSGSTDEESTQIVSSAAAPAEPTVLLPESEPAPVDAATAAEPAAALPEPTPVEPADSAEPTVLLQQAAPVNAAAPAEPTVVLPEPAPVDPASPGPAPLNPAPFDPASPGPAPFDPASSGAAPYDPALFGIAPPPAPAAPRNLPALLGVILAVPLWPVGLVLSTIGLFNAYTRRTGKVLAIIGLVLSIVVGGAIIAALSSATSTVSASTALDPGCASVEASLPADLTTLKTDAAGLVTDENSASSSNTAIDTVKTDLGAIQGDVETASGVATHTDVTNDLNAVNTQVQSVITALTAIEGHSTSSDGTAAAALTTLQSTDANLDSLCAAY